MDLATLEALGLGGVPAFLLLTVVELYRRIRKLWTALEAQNAELTARIDAMGVAAVMTGGDVPRWIRTQDGTIVSVSPEFVRVVAAPHGYRSEDLVGRKLEDLDKLSPRLVAALADLSAVALREGYASAAGVPVTEDLSATVITAVKSGDNGNVVHVGVLAPEREVPTAIPVRPTAVHATQVIIPPTPRGVTP